MRTSHALFLIFSFVILMASTGSAQDSLQHALHEARQELASLRRIIHALDIADKEYISYFPGWTILDQGIRLRVHAAFRSRGIPFNPHDRIVVLAGPPKTHLRTVSRVVRKEGPAFFSSAERSKTSHQDSIIIIDTVRTTTQEIIDIRIGDASYGRLYGHSVMDQRLRDDVVRRQYAFAVESPTPHQRSPRPSRFKIERPSWVSADLSLFGGSISFGNDWSIVGKVGDDVLGYPFWSSGQTWVLARYKSIQLGARIPVHGGLNDFTLGLRSRLLNGSSGFAGEFEFEWDILRMSVENCTYGAIGGSFAIGSLNKRRPELLTPDLSRLYSIPLIAQAYYAFDFSFDGGYQYISTRLGAGFHRVSVGKAVGLDIVELGEGTSFVDPVVRVEYANQREEWFRLYVSYARLLLLGAWAEVLPKFIAIEVKYSTVLLREPRPWEHENYIYGSLMFSFNF